MLPEQMYKLEGTWLDCDSTKHTTLIYTSFEVDDEAAEKLINLHSDICSIELERIEDFTVTPPIDEQ